MKNSAFTFVFLSIMAFNSTNSLQAAVVMSKDVVDKCENFRVTTDLTPKKQNEVMILDKDVYGLSTQNQEIDFENRVLKVDLMALVVFGLNRNLKGDKIRITDGHPEFINFSNQLNRKIMLLEEVCLSKNNEVIKFKYFDTENK